MDDTIALIEAAHRGDKEARDRLVMENMGLIWSIVRRFSGRGYETEDLFQIGSIGLMKAIDKFDLNYDVKFSTYAVPMIAGEIKRFLRDDGMIKVSRSLKEAAGKAKIITEKLHGEQGREPTIEEVAKEIGISSEELVMALDSQSEVESIYKTIYQGDGNAITLLDKLEEEVDANEELLNHMVLEELLSGLDEKERNIIQMRYFMDKTQTEIAKEIGISQVQVSRLEKKILQSMREKL
ncbi:MAG: RNA polymerase sporulation sigma factor SigF [Lachnospiraceae bacterium]|jgi:RNA polymerase sporulation-specific sigma factor|nr:RNA polymerase sporulation sigma factor SigF [Lachnospiraceae bacterium]